MQVGLISKKRVAYGGTVSHRPIRNIKHIDISGVVLTDNESQTFDNEEALRENRAIRREMGIEK